MSKTSHRRAMEERAAWEFRDKQQCQEDREDILIEQEGEEDGRDYSVPQTLRLN